MTKANAQTPAPSASRPGPSGDETRALLLEAASSLVAERGWGSVTTRAVAERAGVNPALVHYHFGTMESLLREAVLARLRPVLQALADELLDDRPFPDGIHRTMRLLDTFDLSSETGVLMTEALLRVSRDEQVADAMSGVMVSWTDRLEPRIVTAQARGVVRDDISATALARILAAMLDGFVIQRLADPSIDPDAMADTLTSLLAPTREESR
jgi:AcrR family transcriptional regulator